jgi:hypothetical protein
MEDDMHRLMIVGALVAGMASIASAQSNQQSQPPAQGRGRGGAPFAWNDKDKDGICDITGKPVGQCRGAGRALAGRGRGGGPRWAGRGRGPCGAGMGRGAAAAQPAPAAKPAPGEAKQ